MAKQNPVTHGETEARSSKLSQGCRARCPQPLPKGDDGSSLTHRARAGSVRVVQVSPEHRPCKAIGNMGSPSAQEQGEHPSFWEGGRAGRRNAGENEQCRLLREKVLGKMSSIPGDQVGKHYPGISISFGKEPGSTGACSKGGSLENTAPLLFQAPLWGDTGLVLLEKRAPAASHETQPPL